VTTAQEPRQVHTLIHSGFRVKGFRVKGVAGGGARDEGGQGGRVRTLLGSLMLWRSRPSLLFHVPALWAPPLVCTNPRAPQTGRHPAPHSARQAGTVLRWVQKRSVACRPFNLHASTSAGTCARSLDRQAEAW
jgi:hypothetical protein